MLRTLLLLTVFNLSYSALMSQAIPLKGQVSIHNSKYETGTIQYVENAYVSAFMAGSTNTDNLGIFELNFKGIARGETVEVTVEKSKLEVVNKYDLLRVIIGRKSPLRVYLAKRGKLAQAQTELYEISKKALFAKKNALIARLRKGKTEREAALKELETSLGKKIPDVATAIELLESQNKSLEKRLPKFAQELAAVNLDFASDLYIKAYEHYKKGEIEKAILVLDDAQLDVSYKNAMIAIKEAKTGINALEAAINDRELQIEQIIKSYELKAESFSLLFEYRKATEVYLKIVQMLKETKGENSLEIGDAYGVLGSLYRDLGEYNTAFFYRKKNVRIKEDLLSANDVDLAISYNNLAQIYKDLGDYEEALKVQQKSLVIEEKANEPNNLNIAISYNNIAMIYKNLRDYQNAFKAQKKSIIIIKKIPDSNHLTEGEFYNNLALIYRDLERYENALEVQKKSLNIITQVYKLNHPTIGTLYNNLALIYKDLGDYQNALEAQKKSTSRSIQR